MAIDIGPFQVGNVSIGPLESGAPPPGVSDYIPPRVVYRIIVEGELLNAENVYS